MTSYAPIHHRKSLLENCLFNAFKDEWKNLEKTINSEIDSNTTSEESDPFAYESFNLSKCNQSFNIEESELFTNATTFFNDMQEISKKKDILARLEHDPRRERLSPRSRSFNSSMFDVVQIEQLMSFQDAIKFIHNLYLSSPELIYGVLLHNGSKFINPLHPLIAQSIVKKYNDIDKDTLSAENRLETTQYKIIIYTYSSRTNSYRSVDNFYFKKDLEEFFTKHVVSVLALLELKTQTLFAPIALKSIRDLHGPGADGTQVAHFNRFSYTRKNLSINSSDNEVHMQPVQLINDGLASPYYGITVQKYTPNDGTLGFNLSPMLSCNIGRHYIDKRSDGSLSINGANVCTGNFSNQSTEGRLSLNHANLNSPYYNDIVAGGSFTFVDVCVKISLGIYAEFFDLPKIDFMSFNKKLPPISFHEFKIKNPEATLKEYLLSIRNES